MSNNPSVTIHDVAAAAGVSVSTVSRVLNNKQDVAPATQAKVLSVISDLGYSSRLAAISMRRKRTHVIGAVIFDLGDPFSIEVIKGLGSAVRGSDYDILMYGCGRSLSSVAELEREHVARLNGSITDGMILVAPTSRQLRSSAPLVVIDPLIDDGGFPNVLADNLAGATAAMNYLIELGHRDIGFIGGRADLLSAHERHWAYLGALNHAGIAPDPQLQQAGGYTRCGGFCAAQKLLDLAQPPTAIFAANDQTAFGVIDAARSAGLDVPGDLSVVGFDNTREAHYADPPLTTVDQSIEQMTRVATEMLIELIEDRPLVEAAVRVPTTLIIRESCAAVA